jgi:pimeloyl-ACP methyl ester carboxylesterase
MTLRSNTQEVELNALKIAKMGDDKPKETNNLFFLHGILGKGQNWKSFALNSVLSDNRDMHLIDLRNHGESDHHLSMTYDELAGDLLRYADQREISKLTLLGHNIGAKTAMTFSCRYPDRVAAMISLDTAPISFSGDTEVIKATKNHFQTIKGLKVEGKTRKVAIETIQKTFTDIGIANFIASNLVYDEKSDNKTVKWCVNLDAIIDNL